MSKFSQLAAALAERPGVTDPKALAAAIGRKKYGVAGFERKSLAGRKKKASRGRLASSLIGPRP